MGKQDVTDELKVPERHFKSENDVDLLISELQLLPIIFECEPVNLEEVVKVLKSLSREKCMLVENCVIVIQIILTVGVKPERSSSILRSKIAQKRLNSLSILYDNNSILDDISLFHVVNNTFGSFANY